MARSRLLRILLVAAPLALVAGGTGAHFLGSRHIAYYTGEAPRTMNCASCHFDARGGTLRDRILRPRYKTPLDVAACADDRLYAVAQDADALLVIDARAGRLVSEIPVGRRPYAVAVDRDCSFAYVSNEEDDTVSVVDLARGRSVGSLPSGDAPHGLAVASGGGRLYVADWLENDVAVLDPSGRDAGLRLLAGSNPNAVALSPDGSVLLVVNELSRPARFPQPPVSEITLIDPRAARVTARLEVVNAHMLEDVAFAPEGDLALVPLVRPKNLVPALQVERGWMMTNGVAVVDLRRGRVAQMPLDDIDAFYADPAGVAVSPDGRYAFVSHAGVDLVSVIDLPALRRLVSEADAAALAAFADDLALSRRYVVKRIAVGANPRGLAVSGDGRRLYVAERLDDRIGIVDLGRLEKIGSIDLGGPRHITVRRRGERLFNSASATLQRQFSCRSCHPNDHVDRLQYDLEPDGLGRNIVDNRTLLGIDGTGPFKWNGRNTSLYMQCGIRFARFLTRSEPFPPDDLNALVAFISSLQPRAKPGRAPEGTLAADGALTPAQRRGREIFERARRRDGIAIRPENRCTTCHPAPLYTNRLLTDVGSAGPSDDERAFDTPQLLDLKMTAPYLHDGRALTLEEIWTLYSPNDTHGVTSDLGKSGLNDLIEYLKTL
jgi:DNA-binding beta-propeller fold protein YncE